MIDRTVIRFPGAHTAGYSDTAAINDIHAILGRRGGQDVSTLEDIALILARTGRLMIDVRDIEATVGETPAGLPEARVDAGDTKVTVHQDQDGGLVVAITATEPDEADLTVTLNSRRLYPAAR